MRRAQGCRSRGPGRGDHRAHADNAQARCLDPDRHVRRPARSRESAGAERSRPSSPWGDVDEVGAEQVSDFAKVTPGARYERIPNSAHITSWDNPDVIARVIRSFLSRRTPRPGRKGNRPAANRSSWPTHRTAAFLSRLGLQRCGRGSAFGETEHVPALRPSSRQVCTLAMRSRWLWLDHVTQVGRCCTSSVLGVPSSSTSLTRGYVERHIHRPSILVFINVW